MGDEERLRRLVADYRFLASYGGRPDAAEDQLARVERELAARCPALLARADDCRRRVEQLDAELEGARRHGDWAYTELAAALNQRDALARRVAALEAALRALVDAAALTYDGGQLRYVCPACDAVEIQGVIDHAPDCARLRAEALLAGDGGEG